MRELLRHIRLAWHRWTLARLLDEQRLYIDTGRAGPIFEREIRLQQLAVMARIRQLEIT